MNINNKSLVQKFWAITFQTIELNYLYQIFNE